MHDRSKDRRLTVSRIARAAVGQGARRDDPDVLTAQQARDYLGVGWNDLKALVRRGVITPTR